MNILPKFGAVYRLGLEPSLKNSLQKPSDLLETLVRAWERKTEERAVGFEYQQDLYLVTKEDADTYQKIELDYDQARLQPVTNMAAAFRDKPLEGVFSNEQFEQDLQVLYGGGMPGQVFEEQMASLLQKAKPLPVTLQVKFDVEA